MEKLKGKFYIVCKGGFIVYLDKENFYKVYKYKWAINKNGKSTYAVRKNNGKTEYMHHAIFGKPINGLVIDHINNDGLDNRKKNIRIVTRSVNSLNNGKTKGYYKKNNKYVVRIWANKKSYRLGVYKTEIEAINVVKKFKKEFIRKMTRGK